MVCKLQDPGSKTLLSQWFRGIKLKDVKYPAGREEFLTWLVDAKLSFPDVSVLSMDGVVLVSVGDICTVNAESLSTIPDGAEGDSLDEVVILLLAAAKKNIRSIPRDKPAPAGSISVSNPPNYQGVAFTDCCVL